ncbi:MAG: GatB/YqeY domain-containing protein [Xanthomonadales bacterium]|nr:GatB/YqeY domain-containing protein [Xanthomonadales bacterium]
MSLKTRLVNDMKTAMKAGDKPRLGVIRLMLAAVNQREVDERIELDDGQMLTVLEKMLKQRRDSAAQYQAAGRADLADQEQFEIQVVQTYLPEPLSESALDAILAAVIADTGASGPRDMGKVMAELKSRTAGRAEMQALSARVKAALAG